MKGDAIMNNYYNIVTKILEIAKKHIFIKEAHYGDIYEFHNSGNRNYSTFVLTQGENNQINENYTQYNFTAFVTDRLTDDEKNLLEVQSNCATILNQIMIEIQDELEYFSESETMSFWKEKFNDLCAGCFIQFSLQVPNDYICNNDIFMTKSLTITENGEYSTVGYDTAIVNVHSTDVFNYFTLYPSNYIYANYLDLSTEIVANVKFTGDKDFYFCSDEKGLIGLYFNAEENETYAWWDSDRLALHFHKRDWEKGFYKIQFKAGRLQIGYLTWTLNSNSSTTSFDPLYFGYMSEKTSPMEIEYITISNQYGAAYDYRPKITDEYAELVEVISGKIADIRTVYEQNIYEVNVLNFLNNGGTFAYYSGPSIPKIDWSKLDKQNYDYFFHKAVNLTNDDLQNFMNLYTDDKSFKDATTFNDDTFRYNGVTELNLVVPKGFKNSKKQNVLPTNVGNYTKINQVIIDCNNSLEYSGTVLGWSYYMTLTLLNTQNLKTCYTPACEVNINRFYAGSLTTVPMNSVENKAAYFGGFIDLGKGLQQNGSAINHTMTFYQNSKATRESILNIFNDLYDLNLLGFTFVNKPTIKLGPTVWNRVTEEDIKIATDKGWTVIQ